MPEPMTADEFSPETTRRGAAEIIGCHVRTIDYLIRTGKLTVTRRIGRNIIFRKADVLSYKWNHWDIRPHKPGRPARKGSAK